MGSAKIYVGNLPQDVKEREIEGIFSKYGKIRYCDIKGGRGPLYAFVEFDDERDAEDAVRGRDGYDFDGHRIRVEFCKGGSRGGPRGGGGGNQRGTDFRGTQYADRISGGYRRGGSRRTDNRVIVSGLPTSGSWQDLKDHMREAGDVCFTDVAKDGTGIVEYSRYEDMKYAVKKLHDTKFRSHEGETSYITVKEDAGNSRRISRSRSRSPRSRSRSPRRRESPRRDSPRRDSSASPPPKKSASRSPSRSRSRSRSRS